MTQKKFFQNLGFSVLTLTLVQCNNAGFQDVSESAEDWSQPLSPMTEYFEQTKDAYQVDLLIVDDNSGSMFEEQEEFGRRFPNLVSALAGLDWQLGITTTDTNSPALGLKGSLLTLAGRSDKILKPSTPSYANVFTNTVRRTETRDCAVFSRNCPTDAEKPMLATTMAIQKSTGENSLLFRPSADLAVVIITDEDEDPRDLPRNISASDVVEEFRKYWPQKEKKFSVYGIYVQPGDQPCLDQQLAGTSGVAKYAHKIDELVKLTGGVSGSICSNDYSAILSQIGSTIRDQTFSVDLLHKPSKNTTRVTMIPDQGIGWRLNGSRVIFDLFPRKGTQIKVEYQRRGP